MNPNYQIGHSHDEDVFEEINGNTITPTKAKNLPLLFPSRYSRVEDQEGGYTTVYNGNEDGTEIETYKISGHPSVQSSFYGTFAKPPRK